MVSPTMVPMDMRWRRAARRSTMRCTPVFALLHPVEFVIRRKGPPPVVTMARTSLHSCSSMVEKACVVSMRSRSASARNPSPTARVHRNWTSTSNERTMGRRGSISPVSTALRRAAASNSSSPNVGRKWILLSAPGWWPLRPRALDESGDPFGTANLDNGLHRTEIHPEIQGTRADHRLQFPFVQGVFHPKPQLLADAAVVQSHGTGEVGMGLQDLLVPDFGLRAGVGEDQRAGMWRMMSTT